MTTIRKNFTHVAFDVGIASAEAIEENNSRVWCLIINDSDTPIYLKWGLPAVVNEGVRLDTQGGSIELSFETGFIDNRAVNAIHGGTGTKRLLITWA